MRSGWGLVVLLINLALVGGALSWIWATPEHPYRSLISSLAFIANSLSIALLGLWVVQQKGGIGQYAGRGWALIALAGLSNGIGDVVWLIYDLQGLAPFPSLADVLYLGFYPLMLAGILQFTKTPEVESERWLFWVDLAIALIYALTLMWYFPVRALLPLTQGSAAETLLAFAYPLGSTALLVAVVLWVLRPKCREDRYRHWLLFGLSVFLGADLLYVIEQSSGQYQEGGFVDALYHLSLLTLMTSAWLAIRAGGPPTESQAATSEVRPLTGVPYLATGTVYTLLLLTAFGWSPPYLDHPDQRLTLIVLVLVGTALTILLLIRQAIAIGEAARLRAQQAIEQHERRFAALARHSSDLILLVDERLRPHFVSQSFEHLLGCKPAEAGKRSLFELIHPDDQQQAAYLIARSLLAPDTPLSGLWRMRHAEGGWRDIEIIATNLSHNPAVSGLVLNGRDVTERRRYERALEKARAETEAASRAKDLFLANMSHEIRTPLQAILGFIDLLLDSPLTPQQRDYLERMQEAGRSLHALLNDILDYSRLQSGRLHLESIPLTILHLIERCRALFELQARHKGLTLDFTIDPEIPVRLKGDPLRLLQILNNLVGNAIKFTHQGGVWVEVSCLKQTPELALIEFRVRDSGIGIAPEQQHTLFTAFQQADVSISRRYGGSGLGLSICKRLVELMDGEMGVESKAGEGSTFWFRVPLELVSPQAEEEMVTEALLPRLLIEPADAADPQPAPAACTLPPCPEPIRQGLAELAVLLEVQNSRARHLNRKLIQELQGTPWQVEYEPIAQAIAMLDFESARQRLRRLLG